MKIHRLVSLLISALFGTMLVTAVTTHLYAQKSLKIFAASSLFSVMNQIGHVYEKKHGHKIIVNFAASSTLAHQLAAGAHADIFISANRYWIDHIIKNKFVNPEMVTPLAKNRLAIVVPISSKNNQEDFSETLKSSKTLSMGDPHHVPLGIYSRQLLKKINLWKTLSSRKIYANHAQAALFYVAKKEADIGIVYYTDAIASDQVFVKKIFEKENHDPILYWGASFKGANNQSKHFLDFLRSGHGKDIFIKAGFLTPMD